MNEYTRREEIRWTLVTVCILVPAVAIAIVRLVMAEGPMVENPQLVVAEQKALQSREEYKPCIKSAEKLESEVDLFRSRAAQAKKKAEEAASSRPRAQRNDPIEVLIPWSAAAPVMQHVRKLSEAGCRAATEEAVNKSKSAAPAWKAVRKAARLKNPGKSKKAQQRTAAKLLKLFAKAPLAKLKKHATKARDHLDEEAEKATARRTSELIRAPLPRGLFSRGVAIGVGVGVALAALIISYISVRSASLRRGRTLVALRRFANTPEAGLQAAAIVRLGAHHNGGEPGMVVGAALGGMAAAVLSPTTNPNIFIADLFVAGSMGGLLIGLAGQWLWRTLSGVSRWRERTKELGDIEKPTIPVALILSGVTDGLEKQFLRYFEALPVGDAATVVQKLAAQAEEKIIAAADAAAQQQYPSMAPQDGWNPPGSGGPPHR